MERMENHSLKIWVSLGLQVLHWPLLSVMSKDKGEFVRWSFHLWQPSWKAASFLGYHICIFRMEGSEFVSATRRPSSFHGFSFCSSPPSPQLPPRWPARWLWWRVRWRFLRCRAGCPPRPAKPRLVAEVPGMSRCDSRQCEGAERAGSC